MFFQNRSLNPGKILYFQIISGMNHDQIGTLILDAAFNVHKALGPGLLESAYENCLLCEMKVLGLEIASQVPLPLIYREQHLGIGYRADLIINNLVLVEIKAVENLNDVHIAQVLTYLKLSNCKLGYLLNFNVTKLVHGIKRIKL
jgi:GxxExxY protein